MLVRERGLLDGEREVLIMAQERDDLVYLAKLAEQAERFDEMVERRRCTHIRRAAAYGGAGAAPRYLATAPRKFGPAESREGRTDVNFRGRRRDARGSMTQGASSAGWLGGA